MESAEHAPSPTMERLLGDVAKRELERRDREEKKELERPASERAHASARFLDNYGLALVAHLVAPGDGMTFPRVEVPADHPDLRLPTPNVRLRTPNETFDVPRRLHVR